MYFFPSPLPDIHNSPWCYIDQVFANCGSKRINIKGEVYPSISLPPDKCLGEDLVYSLFALPINDRVLFFTSHLNGLLIKILHHVPSVRPVSFAEAFDQKEGKNAGGAIDYSFSVSLVH